jgi:NNP family nitrate/nitrite transporter-like MFS transporter
MNIVLLSVCWSLWYLVFSSRAILAPLLPIIEGEYALTHTLAGGLYLCLSVGMTISYLVISGPLAHRLGYKRAITASLLFMTLFIFLTSCTRTYGAFAALCFIVGLGSGVYIPGVIPIITSAFQPKDWGKAIAFHETGAAASILTIPVLTVFFLSYVEWRSLFVILSGALLTVSIFFWLLSPTPSPREKTPFPWRTLLHRRDFWIVLVLFSMAAIAGNSVYSITPLFLINERAFDLASANRIFGYTRAGGFVVTLAVGFFLDRLGAKPIMLVSLCVTGLSTIALAEAEGHWMIVSMMLLQGTASALFFPAVLFAISRLTTLHERGSFTSLSLGIVLLLGVGVAPVFMGWMADMWSFQAGILLIGAATTLTCILFKWLPDV